MSSTPDLNSLPEVAPSEPLPSQSGGFFAKHWRGEYSLPRSYWINGGLIFGLGVNLVIFAVLSGFIMAFHDKPAIRVPVGLGEMALMIAAYVWALVGTWRAAGKYQGAKVWSILARIGMSCGVLITIAHIGQSLEVIGG